MPVLTALADSVQIVFHLRGKAHVHNVREILYQKVDKRITNIVRHEILFVLPHVFALFIGELCHNGSVCRRSAYSLIFHILDKRRFGKANGRLGKFLFLR